jgi:hypothetical protein
VHHSKDKHIVRFDGIENGERKNTNQASSHICLENSPTRWSVAGLPDCRLNAIDESQFKPRPAAWVLSRGFFILFQRLGWNSNLIKLFPDKIPR